MKLIRKNKYLVILFVLAVLAANLYSADYEIIAKVESRRKGRLITVLFKNKPLYKKYFIIMEKKVIGIVHIISVADNHAGPNKYRAIARFRVKNAEFRRLIRSGSEIALNGEGKKRKLFVKDHAYNEVVEYKKFIESRVDKRKMILIPDGKFIFGSNLLRKGRFDEYPRQVLHLKNYYIDKYEVSNLDYKRFIDATNAKPPLSWKDGNYDSEYADLPVLVTYHEAKTYAGWAGKRLPTEQEWEKAARGPGKIINQIPKSSNVYPWGSKFNPGRANCIEFWSNDKIGKGIKKKYRVKNSKLLPVKLFSGVGKSHYGVINMSGNAMEWTSGWYLPYKGNRNKNIRYGKQYKVVRGGAWFSNRNGVRSSNREIGGIPNLYRDNLAGFRCVKDVEYLDKK